MEAVIIAPKRKKSVLHGEIYQARDVAKDIPNDETVAAFEEMERIKINPSMAKRYTSFDALLQDVEMEMAQGVLMLDRTGSHSDLFR